MEEDQGRRMKKTFLISLLAGIVATAIFLPVGYFWGQGAGYDAGFDKGWESGKLVGFKEGFWEGVDKGSKHSIWKFVNETYRDHLSEMDKALSLVKEVENEETLKQLKAAATATAQDVKLWRQVQSQFESFLNSQIDALDLAIKEDDYEKIEEVILVLLQTYDGKRLAIQTELEKISPTEIKN